MIVEEGSPEHKSDEYCDRFLIEGIGIKHVKAESIEEAEEKLQLDPEREKWSIETVKVEVPKPYTLDFRFEAILWYLHRLDNYGIKKPDNINGLIDYCRKKLF